MAQPVRQVGLRAPGFQGLNTELSPINGDPEFALVADNVVVDQIGRLISRKAFAEYRSASGIVLELVGEQDMKGFQAVPNTFMKERGMYDENGDPYIAELFIFDNADPAPPSESPRGEMFWTQGPPSEWNLAGGIQSLDVYDASSATATSTWVLSLELRLSLNETTKNMVIGTFVAIQNGNEIARLDALSDIATTGWERSFRVPVTDVASPITFQFQPNPAFYNKTGNGAFLGFIRRCSLGITESLISTGFEEILKLGKYIYEYRNVQKNRIKGR